MTRARIERACFATNFICAERGLSATESAHLSSCLNKWDKRNSVPHVVAVIYRVVGFTDLSIAATAFLLGRRCILTVGERDQSCSGLVRVEVEQNGEKERKKGCRHNSSRLRTGDFRPAQMGGRASAADAIPFAIGLVLGLTLRQICVDMCQLRRLDRKCPKTNLRNRGGIGIGARNCSENKPTEFIASRKHHTQRRQTSFRLRGGKEQANKKGRKKTPPPCHEALGLLLKQSRLRH